MKGKLEKEKGFEKGTKKNKREKDEEDINKAKAY